LELVVVAERMFVGVVELVAPDIEKVAAIDIEELVVVHTVPVVVAMGFVVH